jgi:hypothetical protein
MQLDRRPDGRKASRPALTIRSIDRNPSRKARQGRGLPEGAKIVQRLSTQI